MNNYSNRLIRGAGVILPVNSIPSPYGIGTFGKESYRFIDHISNAGFRYWQVLPLGPTSYGDSPYQAFSAFAGNPYFIDLDVLVEEGLLDEEEIHSYCWKEREDEVNYELIYNSRFTILRSAYNRSKHFDSEAYLSFCQDNVYWLEDYCLYMAIKEHFNQVEWLAWDEDIKNRQQEALDKYKELLATELAYWSFIQFKFYEQWIALKKYASDKGIYIIGDIPLYVALDSADVWAHSNLFELDQDKNPINVAGVPPDIFSELGQRWGNPLYLYDEMEKEEFRWWKERMRKSASLYDVVRIDHFIGIVNYYSIPFASPNAVEGKWMQGPGKKLTDVLVNELGNTKIIAEDLGILTEPVIKLLKDTGFPGMKIIQFAMSGPANNPYLPHNYETPNTVAYIGTHDNETIAGYIGERSEDELYFACRYFNAEETYKLPEGIIRALFTSIADVVIFLMQDLLLLDNKARINTPSTLGDNWKWRLLKDQYNLIDTDMLYELATLYGRI